jgi:hypothetical protein
MSALRTGSLNEAIQVGALTEADAVCIAPVITVGEMAGTTDADEELASAEEYKSIDELS